MRCETFFAAKATEQKFQVKSPSQPFLGSFTQRLWGEALRDELNNGCEGDCFKWCNSFSKTVWLCRLNLRIKTCGGAVHLKETTQTFSGGDFA